MPQMHRLLAAAMLSLAGLAGLPAADAAERGPVLRTASALPAPMARVIVKFKARAKILAVQAAADGAPQRAHLLSSRLGLALTDGRALGERTQLLFGRGIDAAALAARIAADDEVEWAVPDHRRRAQALPNDPYLPGGQTTITPESGQWYLRAPSGTLPAATNTQAAWNRTTGLSSVVVAVLDTGIRRDHPDLAGKLLDGYDFVSADDPGDYTTANDGNGRDADESDPGDWITAAEDSGGGLLGGCGQSSSSWHGTQTAGLIGAKTNNGVGIAGLGWNVKVLPVRVLGKCGGYDSDIQDAMRWAAGLHVAGVPDNPNPAQVLNLSLGSSTSCAASYVDVIDELSALGVIVVGAAGNEGLAVDSPANCTGVVAVGGLRHIGTKAGYSSLGPEVAISAPAGNCVNETGECLYPLLTTTDRGTRGPLGPTYSDGFDTATLGTSFSTPLVAGALALMISENTATPSDRLIQMLKSSARPFPTTGADAGTATCTAPTSTEQLECYCTTATCGAGMLDVSGAVAAVNRLTPVITGPTAIETGDAGTLSADDTTYAAGATVGYRWAITAGGTFAHFEGSTSAETATLRGDAAGTVTVQLTATDSLGQTARRTRTMTVTAASSGGGGGGGGAFAPLWAFGLVAAIAALRRRPPRA